jgi:PPM family protein phosphatase
VVAVNVRYASLTDVGVKRSHNQDACATQPAPDDAIFLSRGHVFIVADGMGGHAVGEKASAKAVQDIPLTYLKHVVQEGAIAAIRRAFTEANQTIFNIGQNNPEFKGLGTTGTAIFVRPEGAWIGHVGDSRAYRIRNGHVQQLTFDHSWVWEVARRQGIDPDELGDFKRNVIIRSLGPDEEVEVDIEGPHPLLPGDTFLLCSDGLTNEVTADEIGAVASSFPPEQACQYLVNLANIRGGKDNVTCLIVQIPGSGSVAGVTASRGIARKLINAGRILNKRAPWPFWMLSFGAILAVLSVWLKSAAIFGSTFAFLGAAVFILCGLVGLYFYLRKREDQAEIDAEATIELRVYRDYTFQINQQIADRFGQMQVDLKANAANVEHLDINWPDHDKFVIEAESAAKAGDWAKAFRSRFLAVQLLGAALHKIRDKNEIFQPNWTTRTFGV